MAGKTKEPGPTAKRVASNVHYFRRARRDARDVTTAALSQRLTAVSQPIPDTSITKTEKGDRRVDVDDLVALALALGVTPNALLLPPADSPGAHHLTPQVAATATELWEWAQGERPLHFHVPGMEAGDWLGNGEFPALEFSLRNRPYLTAARDGRTGKAEPSLRELAFAVTNALAEGVSGAAVRRVVELVITMPAVMPAGQMGEEIMKLGRKGDDG